MRIFGLHSSNHFGLKGILTLPLRSCVKININEQSASFNIFVKHRIFYAGWKFLLISVKCGNTVQQGHPFVKFLNQDGRLLCTLHRISPLKMFFSSSMEIIIYFAKINFRQR
jgi:hypothetical protein